MYVWGHLASIRPSSLLIFIDIIVIVDETELRPALSLGDHDFATVATLAINFLEPPYLGRSPSIVHTVDVAEDKFAVALDLPAALQVGVLDFIEGQPLAATSDGAEEPIGVFAGGVVEAAVLLGACEARGGLVNVDVGEAVARVMRWLGRSLVLSNGEGNGGVAYAGANDVSDALNDQSGVRGFGQCLVLIDYARGRARARQPASQPLISPVRFFCGFNWEGSERGCVVRQRAEGARSSSRVLSLLQAHWMQPRPPQTAA